MPFEIGNTHAAKGKIIHAAIRKAVTQDDGKRVRAGIERMLDLFAEGDPFAMTYIRDTLDGKPAQSLTVDSDEGMTMIQAIRMVVVTQDKLTSVQPITIDQSNQALTVNSDGDA